MKFDFAIGNPPYHKENKDSNKNKQYSIYNKFMEESYKISKCCELITPSRFLFEVGDTPSQFNKKMLEDEHFNVLEYEEYAENIFPNTEIKGGIAIHIRDEDKVYGAIKEFIPYPELKSIKQEINIHDNHFLDEIMFSQGTYRLADKFFEDYPDANRRLKKMET
ncbi:MAG: Eco57I restriction-modification methylase domain-containing protein [Methanosphaera sp.]|nr:Eco57I restriction-modification methylase domain-containing protein [Methanosphaera sp.]